MAVYAVCVRNSSPHATYIRGWNGVTWTDITANFESFVTTNTGFRSQVVVMDIQVINRQPTMLVNDYGAPTGEKAFILRWTGTLWRRTWWCKGTDWADSLVNGFVAMNDTIYVYGTFADDVIGDCFAIWQLTARYSLIPYALDRPHQMVFTSAWRECAKPSPKNKNLLIIGDAFDDQFGWYDFSTNTFHQGSRPRGSCVFAVASDNDGTMWAGDLAAFYYWSTDGGKVFNAERDDRDDVVQDPTLGETWCFSKWNGQLYAVGCQPSVIMRRNSKPIPANDHIVEAWDVLYSHPYLNPYIFGDGFIACQPESLHGGRLIIGSGGEPFYYNRSGVGAVYAWDGQRLADIGQGLDWLEGVYLLGGDTGALVLNQPDRQAVHFW